MIPLLLLAALAVDPPPIAAMPGSDAVRFAACAKLARTDPARSVAEAEYWARRAPGVAPRHCLGLAYAAAERWAPAQAAFEQAAALAAHDGDGGAGNLWSQAGNAALAGDQPAEARALLDKALADALLTPPMQGEAWLDRARADVALGNLPGARTDLDRGLKLVAADPYAWLLSATLARRQKDLTRARTDIAEALRLAPDDAGVALEAGNVAAASGAGDAARTAWAKAAELAPGSDEAAAAKAALAAAR